MTTTHFHVDPGFYPPPDESDLPICGDCGEPTEPDRDFPRLYSTCPNKHVNLRAQVWTNRQRFGTLKGEEITSPGCDVFTSQGVLPKQEAL